MKTPVLLALVAVGCGSANVHSIEDAREAVTGAVHYVATDGSDANDGSLDHPWATIQHASTRVAPGDTVVVRDGTYHLGSGGFRGDIAIASSGSPTARTVYKAEHKWQAKLVGSGSGDGSTVIGVSGSYNTIQDFDVTGTDANLIILATSGTTTSYNQAIGNYAHDMVAPCDSNGGTAISSGGGDDYNPGVGHMDILSNVVANVRDPSGCSGTEHGAGIFASVPYTMIANNLVIAGGRWAIESWHEANHVTYFGNVVVNSYQGLTIGAGDSPNTGNVNDYSLVQNNIVYGGRGVAIVETGRTGTHNRYLDNLVYGGDTAISLNNGLTAEGTVTLDPLFVNPNGSVTGDYRLRAESPARGRGLALAGVMTDLAGTARPQSGPTDIGAYLYTATGAAQPPAAGIAASATSATAGQSSTLAWTTSNAVTADLNGTPVPLDGSQTVTPAATTTYRITATSSTGATDWGQVTITVAPAAAVAAGISANVTTLAAGQSSVLSWTTKNATSASLNGAQVPLNGSETVWPSTTTAYRIVATGADGATDWGQVTVTVE